MSQLRDRSAQLSPNEIEAIKALQAIISRMAENSAKTKNFFFTISAAFVALIGTTALPLPIILAGYAAITAGMWVMDARYLQLEQRLRGTHKQIVNGCLPELDAWMFAPSRDCMPLWRLMLWNFSTAIYPLMLAALAVVVLVM